jgi:hypothetical protein
VRLDLATAELNPLDSTLTPPWETEIPIELSGAGNWRIRPRLLGERWFGVLWTESPPSTFEIVTAGGGAPRAIVRTLEGELVDTYNDDLVLLGPADRSEPFSVIRLTDGAQVGRLPRPPVGGMLGVRVFDGKTFGWINEPVRRDGGFNVVTYTFEARNLISGAWVWTHRSVAKVPVWNPPP